MSVSRPPLPALYLHFCLHAAHYVRKSGVESFQNYPPKVFKLSLGAVKIIPPVRIYSKGGRSQDAADGVGKVQARWTFERDEKACKAMRKASRMHPV